MGHDGVMSGTTENGLIRPFFTQPAADESDAVFVPPPASDLAQHGSPVDPSEHVVRSGVTCAEALVLVQKSGSLGPGFMPHWRRQTRLARKGMHQHLNPQAAADNFW